MRKVSATLTAVGVLLAFSLFIIGCNNDNNDNGAQSCLTLEEIANTECPAEAINRFCEQFFCGFCIEPSPAPTVGPTPSPGVCGDFFLPPSDAECQVVDCDTLDCGKDGIFTNLQVGEGGFPFGTTGFDGFKFDCFEVITASPTPNP